MKSQHTQRGFTLIELLTVIAIISILAAMIFVGGPKVIERTRLANLTNTCNQIRTLAVDYYTQNSSLPPAYGYPFKDGRYNLKPYLAYFDGQFGNYKIYDPFGQSTYDTDRDGQLSLLEYCPIGTLNAVGNPVFAMDPADLFLGPTAPMSAPVADEYSRQLNGSNQRPLAYIPVNLRDAERTRNYWLLAGDGDYAVTWDPTNPMPSGDKNPLTGIKVPPAKLDAFVLISLGPAGHTGGLLTPDPAFVNALDALPVPIEVKDRYYYFALRTYYLATRDLNKDGKFDFDFKSRTGSGEDKQYLLPDGSALPGPIIYHFAG